MTDYDAKLGKITKCDREYAHDMIEDLGLDTVDPRDMPSLEEAAAEWLRKVRYEAVISDRETRQREYDRMRGALEVISANAADGLQRTQAIGALPNIGPKV